MLKYKIILAGAKNVGKSSLIARYCDDVFNEKMKDTIGVAFKRKKVQIDENLAIELNIWDFGGEEKYRILFPAYANGAAAALILYDTTNKQTLEEVRDLVELIDNSNKEAVIKIIIGTKIDLKDKYEVSKEDILNTCKEFKILGFIETSSKTGENVEEAFLIVVKNIMNNNLRECKECKDYFSKKLKFCIYCGQKV